MNFFFILSLLNLFITCTYSFKILFIGNSLSKCNCLPCKVSKISPVAVKYNTCFKGGSPLIYHLTTKKCRRYLRRKKYNAIVLQEQSQMFLNPNYNEYAVKYMAKRFENLYIISTWPHASDYYNNESIIRKRIKKIATKYNITVIPVSIYWTWVKLFYPQITLTTDGIHPSLEGTFLTACIISRTLHGKMVYYKPKRMTSTTHKILLSICKMN